MKFTPGSWKMTENRNEATGDHIYYVDAENWGIAAIFCWGRDGEYDAIHEANARLIAAAPEMYEALAAMEWSKYIGVDEFCPCCGGSRAGGHINDCLLAAALAAAEGES